MHGYEEIGVIRENFDTRKQTVWGIYCHGRKALSACCTTKCICVMNIRVLIVPCDMLKHNQNIFQTKEMVSSHLTRKGVMRSSLHPRHGSCVVVSFAL